MAELLTLRGRNALSPFRVAKLLSSLAGSQVHAITADFWHFVQSSHPLEASERQTLDRLLSYGAHTAQHEDKGELLLV
ncbi:MAG: hypothetical protein E6H66_09640, partial [Betaproteobacteria bacterium]